MKMIKDNDIRCGDSGLYKECFYTQYELHDLDFTAIIYDIDLFKKNYYEDLEDFKDQPEDELNSEAEQVFIEKLSYYNTYYMPMIFNEKLAYICGLVPFNYNIESFPEAKNLLALGGCGMDLSPRLDAYYALTMGRIDKESKYFSDYNYFKDIVGAAVATEVGLAINDKKVCIKNAGDYFNDGNEFYVQQEYKKAIKCYDKALELDPDDTDAYYKKGNALNHLERSEEALECWDKALELDPEYAEVYYKKGNALNHLERSEEALECWDKVLELDPDDADAYYKKGNALSKLERHKEASSAFRQALELNSNFTEN